MQRDSLVSMTETFIKKPGKCLHHSPASIWIPKITIDELKAIV